MALYLVLINAIEHTAFGYAWSNVLRPSEASRRRLGGGWSSATSHEYAVSGGWSEVALPCLFLY